MLIGVLLTQYACQSLAESLNTVAVDTLSDAEANFERAKKSTDEVNRYSLYDSFINIPPNSSFSFSCYY